MLLLKLETELEVTKESGKAFHILITRLVNKFLLRSEITCSLANLSELPQVVIQRALKKQEELISTRPYNNSLKAAESDAEKRLSEAIKQLFRSCLKSEERELLQQTEN